jgi:hypothetical protein
VEARRHVITDEGWGPALVAAVPTVLFVLGLFYYWFAVADRYAIFLYGHSAPGIPLAQPFDAMTRSRYWMAGLVAAGAVMVICTAVNWVLGRLANRRGQDCRPPAWWRVWVLCALPLIVGIPAITMTRNTPTLPLGLAAACVIATLVGLALALLPGEWAARRPVDLVWLACDGVGLMPILLLLRAIELPGRGVSVTMPVAVLMATGGLLAGIAWLGVMTALGAWRRKPTPTAGALLAAGLCLSYLLMPFVHHLLATPPGYRYISTASNFFAFSPVLQLVVFATAAGVAVVTTRLRGRYLPISELDSIPHTHHRRR